MFLTVLPESVESWTPVIIRILKDGIARSDLPRGLQEKHKKTLEKRTLRLKKADVIPLFTRPPQVGFNSFFFHAMVKSLKKKFA